jgi:hypothetical protein
MAQNVTDLKQALNARSHTATLEELQSRGRRSVRVIRADDVAQMIEAAVGQTIARSGMMSPQEVEELEARSREQFQVLLERRQSEIGELRQAADALREAQLELVKVKGDRDQALSRGEELLEQRNEAIERLRASELQREELTAALRKLEGQRALVSSEVSAAMGARDEALRALQALETQLARAQRETTASVASGVNADLVYRLMGEIAELRAKTSAPAAAAAPDGGAAEALAGALQQLTSTFTAKLDSFGRKIGVSSAVEAEAPNLAGLFKHQDGQKLESNMDSVAVKAKSATGIAANLERLKKLKGGD